MPLTKRFTRIGNSHGLIFDQPLLKQAEMTPETEVEISVAPHEIIIRTHNYASNEDARAAGRAVIAKRRKLMERLAK
jgi:antitoxin component of MazEF toxin-antitoxin module